MGVLNFLCNTVVFQTLFKNKSAIEKLKLHSALLVIMAWTRSYTIIINRCS